MKEFNNKTEREFLKNLFNMRNDISINFGEYLSSCVLKKDRAIRVDTDDANLIFNKREGDGKEFINDVQIIVSLIESLKEDKLIFTHSNTKILQKDKDTQKAKALVYDKELEKNMHATPQNYAQLVLPTTLSGYIKDYIGQFCYIRPELIDYINDNFQTREQIRFGKTLFWTRFAAFIAFTGLILAVIIPFLTRCGS
jgi:hypothetical protein